MNDIVYQRNFVTENAWRLIAQQDMNIASPSYGCFHLAYWRDKTSEFPDARFQEAGATLGLLMHPKLGENTDKYYPYFLAGLQNLKKQQYPEGCFDEWYKGERGFAATHFTITAYGLAGFFLGDKLTDEARKILVSVMTKAGDWLLSRDDLVKTNHEAAACCALALTAYFTNEDRFKVGAEDKLKKVLDVQTQEGWFPELGGVDLGYSCLILDYIMLYCHITEDLSPLPAMKKLFNFVLPHIQPDFTMPAESGLCMNAYFGRIGILLLSQHDDNAAGLVNELMSFASGQDGLKPYLADDLRFSRWSHLPLVAYLIQDQAKKSDKNFSDIMPQGWTHNKASKALAWHGDHKHIYVSAISGGTVHAFHGSKKISDEPPVIHQNDNMLTVAGYNDGNVVKISENSCEVFTNYNKATFFFPSFLQRLILRLGSTTALGSRLLRQFIDSIRLKKKSAVNQSVAPTQGSGQNSSLERSIAITNDNLVVLDTITGFDDGDVKSIFEIDGVIHADNTQHRIIKKTYDFNDLSFDIAYGDTNKRHEI